MTIFVRVKAAIDRFLPQQSFSRSVGVLAGGTAVAQVIGVMALPLITRIFSPEDFSVLAAFSSAVAIMSVAACLRLEIAIPIPEKDEDAANLLTLALIFCTLISAISGLALYLFGAEILSLLKQPKLKPYFWMLPLGIWLTSSYTAIQFWATRRKKFSAIATTRMTQTLGSICTQLVIGLYSGGGSLGLLMGHLIYCGAGSLSLVRTTAKEDASLAKNITLQSLKRSFKKFQNFPKYSTLEALTNSASTDVPILIISSITAGPKLGILFLAMKVMIIPLGMVGRAVGNVYLSHAGENFRQGELKTFTIKVIEGLIKSGVGPLILIGIISPTFSSLAFGEKWSDVGRVISILTPWFVFQYISAPISMALHVTNNQKSALVLQIAGMIIRISAVTWAAVFKPSIIIESYAASSAIFYAIYFLVISKAIGIRLSELAATINKNVLNISIWLAAGSLIAVVARVAS